MNKYLKVKCLCPDYYKFMQKVASLNVAIYNLKYQQKYLYFEVSANDYAKLTKYLKSYKFIPLNYLGIYKIRDFFYQYKILIICFIIGLGLLFLGSNLIVEVNVIHENKEIRELILDELESVGIKTLSFKKSYNQLQKIKEMLLEKYPDKLDWLEFEKDGMIYNVRVEERIITDTSKENKKCNIIATKEGTISNLKIASGEALVRPNDLVKKGDVLISGIIMYNEVEKARVCASGEVFAHTWYTVKVTIPFQHEEYQKTGKKKYNLVWENKNNKTSIFKPRFVSFSKDYKTLLALFDYKLLLETEYENTKKVFNYTEDEALEVGLAKAEENLKKKLGAKDTIIDKKVLKKYVNDSKMDIEIFIIANELISTEQIIAEENEGVDNSDLKNNQNDT